jgi:hypothetical protein
MIKLTCERDNSKIELTFPDGTVNCYEKSIERKRK